MSLSVQHVITEVKGIASGLVGISRVNPALYHALLRKTQALEKKLVSSCDGLSNEPTAQPNNAIQAVLDLEKSKFLELLKDDSLSKAEIIKLLEPANVKESETEDETSKEKGESITSGTSNAGTVTGESSTEIPTIDPLAALLNKDAEEDGSKLG